MKRIDWPLVFVAATSLLGFGMQHQNIRNLSGKVESLSNTEKDVASLKLQYDVVLEELENIRKLSSKDLAGARELSEKSPFTLVDDWWVADAKMFRFPQGIVVGDRYKECKYGNATLSVGLVDKYGGNCPSGEGSVTFGLKSVATGTGSTVTGGYANYATGPWASSVSGGYQNKASGMYSSVTGGSYNEAAGENASVSGGWTNTAQGRNSAVTGGNRGTAEGYASAVSGGWKNKADGGHSVITGGYSNTAKGLFSSISGGYRNKAKAKFTSVLGGEFNKALKEYETVYA